MPDSWLVVGLGNPGRAYQGTLHNAGREVVERLLSKRGLVARETDGARIAALDEGWAMMPETYMNLSGQAVAPFARRKGIPASRVLVLVDDVYLMTGTVRVRASGSPAGHNGLKSIQEFLGTAEYPRVRIGVGPDPGGERRADYVLSRPVPEFAGAFLTGKEAALVAVETILARGLAAVTEPGRA